MSNVWSWLNSINDTKVDLVHQGEDIKQYVPFVANKALSYHLDSILFSNEMNRLSHIPPSLQYQFYLYSLPKRKRISKWTKKENVDELELIKKYYDLNDAKAFDVLNILTKTQIEYIKNKLENCGLKK
jgi:hypothetical protein